MEKSQNATVTVRINHTRTQKAGWQHETTVTLSGELMRWKDDANTKAEYFLRYVPYADENGELHERNVEPVGTTLTELLVQSDTIGREESARRNALDQDGSE